MEHVSTAIEEANLHQSDGRPVISEVSKCSLLHIDFGFEETVKVEYEHFLRKVISFKNSDGFTESRGRGQSVQENHDIRPPLEDIYLLICPSDQSFQGVVRPPSGSPELKHNNTFVTANEQLWVDLGSECPEADCNYSVSIGAIKSMARSTAGLAEKQATMRIYPQDGCLLIS